MCQEEVGSATATLAASSRTVAVVSQRDHTGLDIGTRIPSQVVSHAGARRR
ncbi:hypothetical protein F4561_005634 [Lipingzhangella halophila]|uniref:Uncharacterized protein n=1 Tax=Lipingzhangella halophila TaxID=1783352 RepID=A0A7W7W6D1_9ACTN|nr:hypothetical protein [Lipingzhangella halophila]MBB4934740.1 hypothetical protein [Lipingzhangella halophila]